MIRIFDEIVSVEDLAIVKDYVSNIKFNTKDDHLPLYDAMYSNPNIPFDVHTRGEMSESILDIFSKISKNIYNILEKTETIDYHAPMFSKYYIARYPNGARQDAHVDYERPNKTYKAFLFWNNDTDGGYINFPEIGIDLKPNPGSLVIFYDIPENMHGITEIKNGPLYLSEIWMSPVGTTPFNNVVYNNILWDHKEIKGF